MVRFVDIVDDFQSGITELECDTLGRVTFVGISKEGDAVIQSGNQFTTIPELTWNMMGWHMPFQPETHVKYITEADLFAINCDVEKITDISLSDELTVLHTFKVVLHISRDYQESEQ